MKSFAFLLFLFPLAVAGQTKSDYEYAMAKFQRFYNAGQGDSISAMFCDQENYVWTNKNNTLRLEEFGTLKSFKFIGIDTTDPNKVWVFKSFFSNGGMKTTSLTLDKNKHLDTFRFITESDGITELLKKDKSK